MGHFQKTLTMVSPEQKKLLEFLKLSPIPLDDVLLKPTLLKKK